MDARRPGAKDDFIVLGRVSWLEPGLCRDETDAPVWGVAWNQDRLSRPGWGEERRQEGPRRLPKLRSLHLENVCCKSVPGNSRRQRQRENDGVGAVGRIAAAREVWK